MYLPFLATRFLGLLPPVGHMPLCGIYACITGTSITSIASPTITPWIILPPAVRNSPPSLVCLTHTGSAFTGTVFPFSALILMIVCPHPRHASSVIIPCLSDSIRTALPGVPSLVPVALDVSVKSLVRKLPIDSRSRRGLLHLGRPGLLPPLVLFDLSRVNLATCMACRRPPRAILFAFFNGHTGRPSHSLRQRTATALCSSADAPDLPA